MPPSPVYNWACVINSTAEIISHAARHRAAQLAPLRPTAPVPPGQGVDVNTGLTGSASTNTTLPVNANANANANATANSVNTASFRAQNSNSGPSLSPAAAAVALNRGRTHTPNIQRAHASPLPLQVEVEVEGTKILPLEKNKDTYPEPEPEPETNSVEEALSARTSAGTGSALEASLPGSGWGSPAPTPASGPAQDTSRSADPSFSLSEPPSSYSYSSSTLPPPPPPTEHAINTPTPTPTPTRTLQSSKVPSSRIGRLFHYGGLAASLSYGAAAELIRRTGTGGGGGELSSSPSSSSSGFNDGQPSTPNPIMLSEANIKRLVTKLVKMRGAALKIGQFLSIQDTHILPPAIDSIFRQVHDAAHYMPHSQLEAVFEEAGIVLPLSSSYSTGSSSSYSTGSSSSSLASSSSRTQSPEPKSPFVQFSNIPFAAASIGQVHDAVLDPAFCSSYYASASSTSSTSTSAFSSASGSTSAPTSAPHSSSSSASTPHANSTNKAANQQPLPLRVAVKVQFPGVKQSIESDLSYVSWLLSVGRVLPRGLFLGRTLEVMKSELQDECSYTREASFLRLFASASFLGNDERFKVPWVWEGSTDRVLVMERVEGVGVGSFGGGGVGGLGGLKGEGEGLGQEERNLIASLTIELCLLELFKFHTMQTDPNPSNFLWNSTSRQLGLVDFGATRVYSEEFMRGWKGLLGAAVDGDEERCREGSFGVGYLVGGESETMINAHLKSLSLLATPFKRSTAQPFCFSAGDESEWGAITAEIRALIPVMLQERLTPPPRETYSLNRKLSGAFLLASRLGAKVNTRAIWEKVVGPTGTGTGTDVGVGGENINAKT